MPEVLDTWEKIKKYVEDGKGLVGRASRDFCALECLANAPEYAKPDSMKFFLLWEARNKKEIVDNNGKSVKGVEIIHSQGMRERHNDVYCLFVNELASCVRFPFNQNDTDPAHSLSWETIEASLMHVDFYDSRQFWKLPRWSTASRSCLALIPRGEAYLDNIPVPPRFKIELFNDALPSKRREVISGLYVSKDEWLSCDENRFYMKVKNPGQAAKEKPFRKIVSGRLYSIKTGVDCVGSKFEGGGSAFGGKKNLLEANCAMAMARSEVIQGFENRDDTFGVQTEILTITAPIRIKNELKPSEVISTRDGFQVRDLSCMRTDCDYIPGQAIPYARKAFEPSAGACEFTPEAQCDFWRNNFAIPLGRAKARLFLNYGLIHTSANAQNFILGFHDSELIQLVIRDIGDTSWHDCYISAYLRGTVADQACKALEYERDPEKSSHRHLLKDSTSKDYPAPFIIRVAANSVLTHKFAEALINYGWTPLQVYKFATGILDGFRCFMAEVLLKYELPYPDDPPRLFDQEDNEVMAIRRFGTDGCYPYPTDGEKPSKYVALVKEVCEAAVDKLLSTAARVRCRGKQAVEHNECKNFGCEKILDLISILLNAEEILLCARFENLLAASVPSSSAAASASSSSATVAPIELKERIQELLSGRSPWPPVVKPDCMAPAVSAPSSSAAEPAASAPSSAAAAALDVKQ